MERHIHLMKRIDFIIKMDTFLKGSGIYIMEFSALGVDYAKENKQVYPFYDETSGDICVKRENSDDDADLCKILFSEEKNEETGATWIYIEDIYSYQNINKGFGSAAFRALVKYAINNNFLKITGMIAPVDYNYIDRLEHFYEKNFCKVKINHEKQQGSFSLDLTDQENILLKFENQVLKERISYLEELTEKQKDRNDNLQERIYDIEMELESESKLVKFLKKF